MTARWQKQENRKNREKQKQEKQRKEKNGNPVKFGLRCQTKSSDRYNKSSQWMLLKYKGYSSLRFLPVGSFKSGLHLYVSVAIVLVDYLYRIKMRSG